MPVTAIVDHAARLVLLKGTGRLGPRDIADCLSRTVQEGAADYGALFDISAANVDVSCSALSTFGRQVRLSGHHHRNAGAIAIVASSEAERDLADYFARRARGRRECRLFASAADARAWLGGPR